MDVVNKFRRGEMPPPGKQLAWRLYGAGMENFGREGKPEQIAVPTLGPRELLAQVDASGICFSDIKIIKAGGDHPRLFGRDLKNDPIIIGHEVAITLVGVGEEMREKYKVGDRFVVQAEIYFHGKNLAFGYMLYGGFEQYAKLGDEVLRGDDGCYLIPINNPETGYAEAALAEPWACVVCSYRWTHRRQIKPGGTMWIIGTRETPACEHTLGAIVTWPAAGRIVVTDLPKCLAAEVERPAAKWGVEIIARDGLDKVDIAAVAKEIGGDAGLDDVFVLGGERLDVIEQCAAALGKEGILTIVADGPLAGPVSIDVGRVHYDYIRILGCQGPDISEGYREAREPRVQPGGKFWVVGAGGPMGQMHVQWGIEQKDPPAIIVASDVDHNRLAVVAARFSAEAQRRGSQLVCLNPQELGPEGFDAALRQIAPEGFDDVCCLVPVPAIIADCSKYLGPHGVYNIFAGVGRGTMAPLDLSPIVTKHAGLQGTSGSSIEDLEMTLRLAEAGELNTNMSVAAICGIGGARDGLQAVMEARFPGKTVIYPHIEDLDLLGVDELDEALPMVAEKLAAGKVWSRDAEIALLRKFLQDR
jgi:threonine dehydrogenase-like Zn-dependent dehydrogenase